MNHRHALPVPLARALCALLAVCCSQAPAADFATERARLVATIERDVRDTRAYTGRDELDPRVMEVMGSVPRHEFVPPEWRSQSYLNRPLPIGHGQTISQPYIVALMTDMLDPERADRVLEIGTGSGYQAAVLAELVAQVYSIEIIEPLGRTAAARLAALDYDNVETRVADGYHGWAEQAPFDAIVVTAAASHIPPPLVRQIRPGGVMLIPVGPQFSVQQLTLVRKAPDGTVTTRQILPVRFVPLTGHH